MQQAGKRPRCNSKDRVFMPIAIKMLSKHVLAYRNMRSLRRINLTIHRIATNFTVQIIRTQALITDTTEILFFDRRYRSTSMQYAAYRVEIDRQQFARFYNGTAVAEAFYQELLVDMPSRQQRILYFSLLIKSLTDPQY